MMVRCAAMLALLALALPWAATAQTRDVRPRTLFGEGNTLYEVRYTRVRSTSARVTECQPGGGLCGLPWRGAPGQNLEAPSRTLPS